MKALLALLFGFCATLAIVIGQRMTTVTLDPSSSASWSVLSRPSPSASCSWLRSTARRALKEDPNHDHRRTCRLSATPDAPRA